MILEDSNTLIGKGLKHHHIARFNFQYAIHSFITSLGSKWKFLNLKDPSANETGIMKKRVGCDQDELQAESSQYTALSLI